MNVPVTEPELELESSVVDLRDHPLGEVADPMITTRLADRIMPPSGVSAFNSSI